MNRSITNVLFGGIAPISETERKIEGTITKTSVEETVDALANAESVIIVCLLILMNDLESNVTLGRWLWYGSCKSTVCHLRDHQHAQSPRNKRPICHTPSCWKNAWAMQRSPSGSVRTL
jgi:hypothetical protein